MKMVPIGKKSLNYMTLTGMLGYLQFTTRSDFSMATHQCARFNNCSKLSHERAVKMICKYLLSSKNEGIFFRSNVSRDLECHVDADFS